MFLIMGMRLRMHLVGEGEFHCPQCSADRRFERFQAKRWFTVFFVPLVPLGTAGTHVRCTTCGGRFDDRVLEAPTSAALATGIVTAMRATVAAFLALHETPATVEAAMAAVRAAGMPGYGDADLAWDRQTGAESRARDAVTTIAPTLEPIGREHLLAGALRVPMAEGDLSPQAVELGRRVGAWLGLTAAHVDGIVAHVRAGLSH